MLAGLLCKKKSISDLFSRMILMSGNAECSWAMRQDMVEVSRSFAQKLGLASDLSSEEVE